MSEYKDLLVKQTDKGKLTNNDRKTVPSKEQRNDLNETYLYHRLITDSSKQTVGYTLSQANNGDDDGKHRKK